MNELNPPPAPQKKSSVAKFIIPVLVVIAGVGALGYFASKAGLDKALVKREVDAWIERSKSHAAKEGYDLAITYDDVGIKGGLTDGHALINNLKIKALNGESDVTFATAEVKLEPKSANLDDVEIILPTPIHVFEGANSYESASLVSDTPLAFDIEQIEKDKKTYDRISHDLPNKVTLRFLAGQEAVGEEDKAQELAPRYDSIELTMDGEAQLITSQERSDIGESTLSMRNLSILPVGHEAGLVKVEEFTSRWSNQLNEENLNVIDAEVKLKDLTADEKFLPYAPINASLKAHFEGAMPATPEEFANIRSQQSAFKLTELSLSTKDASVNATADFMANQDDILPVGMANLSITNVQAWRELLKANEVISAKDEEIINTLFIRIAGVPMQSAKDVTVDIQRAREGAFQIGHITFEELLAILLRQVKTPLDTQMPQETADDVPETKTE